MAIDVACPCGERYAVEDHLAGKLARCGVCGRNVAVPVFVQTPILVPTAKAGAGRSASRAKPAWRKTLDRAWLATVALLVLVVFFGREQDREDVLRVATAPFRCVATAYRWAVGPAEPPRDPIADDLRGRFGAEIGDGFVDAPPR